MAADPTGALAVVGTCSYLWWIWVLCWKPAPDQLVQAEFYGEVEQNIYVWPMVAFATTTLLNVISWAFERRTTKKQLCFLAAYISFVAFVYEFLAWKRWAPIYTTATGRPNSILRYIMWGHATPAMLYAMGMMSDLSRQRVAYTIAMDIVMIVTALPGELVPGPSRWVWNFISWAVSPYVFYNLWVMFSAALRESTDDASRKSLRSLRNCTVAFWCGFPLVWTLVQLRLVESLRTEEMLWSCCDLLGKIVFSSSLLHGNFMTIEHRRYMAMRVVEEANRVRVIQELRDLVEQKEQFIALMSHELRTPLNGIIGLSNTLLTDVGGMDADAQKTVSTIHNSGCRLLNLINDILDAAALKKGTLVVQQGKVNLKNVTDDVLDLTQPLAKPGVSVSNRIASGVPPVVGDTARIVQILYNLIGNACKFTDKGDIWVDAAAAGDKVAVRVHDTGIGIPADKLDDIFCPFQQVDMSTTRRYGGTGLGLNLVKQLVEAHGGTITVASKPGVGSTFTFMLRAWDDSRKPSPYLAQLPLPLPAPGGPLPPGDQLLLPPAAAAAAAAAGLRQRRTSAEHPAARSRGSSGSGSSQQRGSSGSHHAPRRHSISGPPPAIPERSWGLGEPRLHGHGVGEEDWTWEEGGDAAGQLPLVLDGEMLAENPAVVRAMWRRLSSDCRARSSYDNEAAQYKKAPQQLDPAAAASVFAMASAPPPRPPEDPLLAAARQRAAAASGGQQPPPGGAELGSGAAAAAAGAGSSGGWEAVGLPGDGSEEGLGLEGWQEAEQRVRDAGQMGAIHVLSVDDDPVNQMVIQRMLSKAGFRVIKAATGDKALDLVQDLVAGGKPPDLVLLDVMMPGMSGYEVARHIRQDYPHLMLPIIMVSANKLEEHVVEGLQMLEEQVVEGRQAGGNDYVTKPFGQKELIARIESQLRIKQFTEAAAARARAKQAERAHAQARQAQQHAAAAAAGKSRPAGSDGQAQRHCRRPGCGQNGGATCGCEPSCACGQDGAELFNNAAKPCSEGDTAANGALERVSPSGSGSSSRGGVGLLARQEGASGSGVAAPRALCNGSAAAAGHSGG
ncbi:hypothetical protein N2152v2_003249 [Parachlorella kessleri]